MRRSVMMLALLLAILTIVFTFYTTNSKHHPNTDNSPVSSVNSASKKVEPIVRIDNSDSRYRDDEDKRRIVESELNARGMGNLRVFEFPSRDPAYYEEKMNETDSIIPDPEYLKESPRPVVFREYVHKHLAEPLRHGDLAFLENKMDNSKDADVRFQCAVLLYRYGSVSGKEYLVSRLGESDCVLAATVLALNREDEYLPQIIKILSNNVENSGGTSIQALNTIDPLLRAVSDWNVPEVNDLLLKLILRSPLQTPGLLAAVARHEIVEAEGSLQRVIQRSGNDVSISYHLAALYALNGDENLIEIISDQINLASTDMRSTDSDAVILGTIRCSYTIDALGLLDSPEAKQHLFEVASELLNLPDGIGISPNLLPGNPLNDLLGKTAVAISASPSNSTADTVTILTSILRKLPGDQNVRLGVAMNFETDTLETYPEFKDAIGDYAIKQSKELKVLNDLPAYFVPDSSVFIISERNELYPT